MSSTTAHRHDRPGRFPLTLITTPEDEREMASTEGPAGALGSEDRAAWLRSNSSTLRALAALSTRSS